MGLSDGVHYFLDPAFALLDTIPAVTDGQTDKQTRCCRKDHTMHSVARVKIYGRIFIKLSNRLDFANFGDHPDPLVYSGSFSIVLQQL